VPDSQKLVHPAEPVLGETQERLSGNFSLWALWFMAHVSKLVPGSGIEVKRNISLLNCTVIAGGKNLENFRENWESWQPCITQ